VNFKNTFACQTIPLVYLDHRQRVQMGPSEAVPTQELRRVCESICKMSHVCTCHLETCNKFLSWCWALEPLDLELSAKPLHQDLEQGVTLCYQDLEQGVIAVAVK
jgi:hypothetical protein